MPLILGAPYGNSTDYWHRSIDRYISSTNLGAELVSCRLADSVNVLIAYAFIKEHPR